ncbi:hypothetical protein [Streptomyces sp. NBC_01264]|uniref:hypothetical protein n=1 Tax=Streptomyces sp. NBC_01264 TaxID=2903804 RepID=UPI0022546622|nr:hypothetical protein [Streptomyces sp. NBC_01264]MCX4783344.1 hypothetical protein [Streptomyces sp. NBC_01264]
MRWRLNDTKVKAQKSNTYRETTEPQHHVNAELFHAPHPSEISGGNPGSYTNIPDMDRDMMEIHPAMLSESVQFYGGINTGYRPAGGSSPSSRNSGTEQQVQEDQHMPAGYDHNYYR